MLTPYPQVRASGAEGLGSVPAHWGVKRLRFVATLNPSRTEVASLDRQTEVTFLPMEAVGEDGSIQTDRVRPIAEVETGYTFMRDGDVVIAKITPCFENGKGAHLKGLTLGIAFGTTELIVARPDERHILGRYLHWLFVSPDFRKQGEAAMYGAGGQKRVPDEFVRNFFLGLPPIAEQEVIAAFLDRETAKIDTLIAEQERLIALLDEKRRAVISRAVTKGLNPDVPMKHSGIEWLGEVPAHWRLLRFKDVCSEIVDCKNRTPDEHEDGSFFVVRTSCVKYGNFDPSGGYYTDEWSFVEWTRKGLPKFGDILLTREAPAGEACLFPEGYELCLGQRMMYLRPCQDRINSEFLLATIYGPLVRAQIGAKSKGSTVGHLRVGEIGELPCLLPPLSEQRTICLALSRTESQFEGLINACRSAIALLKERRAALISAAVTGKIDVRQIETEAEAA